MIIFCLVNLMFLIIKLQTELLVMLPPNVWNNLPYDIRTSSSISDSKKKSLRHTFYVAFLQLSL